MTMLTLARTRAASDAVELTAAESAIVGLAAGVDAHATGRPALARCATPADTPAPQPQPAPPPPPSVPDGVTRPRATTAPTDKDDGGVDTRPTDRAGRRAGWTTPVRLRLVPTLAPLPRLTAPTGPGHSRPPTLDERVLARRRASLAAERAAATAEQAVGPAPIGDPTSVCCSLVLAAVEALAGIRSVAQLARWVTPEVYEALSTRAALTVRVLGARAASRRPEVRRVRVCRIGEHVAEASVVIDDGRRVRAVAVRLESWRGAWRAVALEIG